MCYASLSLSLSLLFFVTNQMFQQVMQGVVSLLRALLGTIGPVVRQRAQGVPVQDQDHRTRVLCGLLEETGQEGRSVTGGDAGTLEK